MKFNLTIFTFICIVFFSCKKKNTEGESEYFMKMYGSFKTDFAKEVFQTTDEGYILVGTVGTTSQGYDASVIKTDKFGNEEWSYTYGDSLDNYANSIKIVSGGYVILGTTHYADETSDMYLFKINESGTREWQRKIGTTSNEVGEYLETTTDGGFILVGSTTKQDLQIGNAEGTRDIYVVKTNSVGIIEWSKNYGSSGNDYATHVIQKQSGGYLILGNTTSFQSEPGMGMTDIMLIDISENGGLSGGFTQFGGSANDFAKKILPIDGGYLILGSTFSKGEGGSDVYVVKIGNSIYDFQWDFTYGYSGNETANDFILDETGNLVIVGATDSEGNGGKDHFILQLNNTMEEEWFKTIGGSGDEEAFSLKQTSDGGYAFFGTTEFEKNQMMNLVKINNLGEFKSIQP
jgi:hypothetical protein